MPAKVGTDVVFSGTTSLAPSWGGDQPRNKGDLLTAIVGSSNGSSTTPTCTTPSGWTLRSSNTFATGVTRIGLFVFDKIAAGADAAPAFTTTTSCIGILSEHSGLDDSATPQDIVFTPSGASSVNCTTVAGTPLTDDDWVMAIVNMRQTSDTFTWLVSLTGDTITSANSQTMQYATRQLTGKAALTPSATALTTGAWNMCAVAYKIRRQPSAPKNILAALGRAGGW